MLGLTDNVKALYGMLANSDTVKALYSTLAKHSYLKNIQLNADTIQHCFESCLS